MCRIPGNEGLTQLGFSLKGSDETVAWSYYNPQLKAFMRAEEARCFESRFSRRARWMGTMLRMGRIKPQRNEVHEGIYSQRMERKGLEGRNRKEKQ